MTAALSRRKSQFEPHLAFLLLESPVALNVERLRAALFSASIGMSAVVLANEKTKNSVIVKFGEYIFTVITVENKLPYGWEPAAQRTMGSWPDAPKVFARHKWHCAVAPLSDDISPLLAARCMTALIGALLDSHAAFSAVLWNTDVASSRANFQKGAISAFINFPHMPIHLWMGLKMFPGTDSGCFTITTLGLRQFAGREIEFDAEGFAVADMVSKVSSFAFYLMQQARLVKDGDTIGASEGDRYRVTLIESRHVPNVPVFHTRLVKS